MSQDSPHRPPDVQPADAPVGPLIHIGYHKTGTTWLQQFLFKNRAAGFAWTGKREDSPVNRLVSVHPFDFRADAAIADFAEPIGAIRRQGLLPVVSLERLSGHPFSGGHDSKEIAHRLGAVFPSGRVLVVVREQRDMIVSTYKQYIRAGGALTLDQFLHPPVYRRPRTTYFELRHFEYHRLLNETGYPPPDEFDQRIPECHWVTCAHPAGTLVLADTTGFHRGGKAVTRNRVLATWAYGSQAAARDRFVVDRARVPADVSAAVRCALFRGPGLAR